MFKCLLKACKWPSNFFPLINFLHSLTFTISTLFQYCLNAPVDLNKAFFNMPVWFFLIIWAITPLIGPTWLVKKVYIPQVHPVLKFFVYFASHDWGPSTDLGPKPNSWTLIYFHSWHMSSFLSDGAETGPSLTFF